MARLLLATSLLPYLEWGGEHAAWIGQLEYEVLFGDRTSWRDLLHPLIALPLTGQLVLVTGLA